MLKKWNVDALPSAHPTVHYSNNQSFPLENLVKKRKKNKKKKHKKLKKILCMRKRKYKKINKKFTSKKNVVKGFKKISQARKQDLSQGQESSPDSALPIT